MLHETVASLVPPRSALLCELFCSTYRLVHWLPAYPPAVPSTTLPLLIRNFISFNDRHPPVLSVLPTVSLSFTPLKTKFCQSVWLTVSATASAQLLTIQPPRWASGLSDGPLRAFLPHFSTFCLFAPLRSTLLIFRALLLVYGPRSWRWCRASFLVRIRVAPTGTLALFLVLFSVVASLGILLPHAPSSHRLAPADAVSFHLSFASWLGSLLVHAVVPPIFSVLAVCPWASLSLKALWAPLGLAKRFLGFAPACPLHPSCSHLHWWPCPWSLSFLLVVTDCQSCSTSPIYSLAIAVVVCRSLDRFSASHGPTTCGPNDTPAHPSRDWTSSSLLTPPLFSVTPRVSTALRTWPP